MIDDTEDTTAEESDAPETEVEETEATETEEPSGEEKQADAKGEASKDTKVLLSGDEGDGEEGEGVPDEYVFTLPKGVEVEITGNVKEQLDAFTDSAKDMGLTQSQYDALIKGEFERGAAVVTKGVADYQQRIEDWADATRSDKELGGDDLAENLSISKRGMDTVGTPKLKELFDAPSIDNPEGLGLGNHPEIIRLLYRVGSLVGEGELIEGDGSKAAADASLRRMYPSMFKDEAA